MVIQQPNLWGEPELISKLNEIEGKTIKHVTKCKSDNGVVKFLQLVFTDGTYCIIISDNPKIDINLMDDTEKVIPE